MVVEVRGSAPGEFRREAAAAMADNRGDEKLWCGTDGLRRSSGVRGSGWWAGELSRTAIYSSTREAVAECRHSSSAKALARLSEHGQAQEHDEGERMKVTE